jgi:hypothetical protein
LTGRWLVTDKPGAGDDDIQDMIEECWAGEDSWTGPVEVAYSQDGEGDAIFTLPATAFMGTTADGGHDVAVPLALMRWVLRRISEASRTEPQGSAI